MGHQPLALTGRDLQETANESESAARQSCCLSEFVSEHKNQNSVLSFGIYGYLWFIWFTIWWVILPCDSPGKEKSPISSWFPTIFLAYNDVPAIQPDLLVGEHPKENVDPSTKDLRSQSSDYLILNYLVAQQTILHDSGMFVKKLAWLTAQSTSYYHRVSTNSPENIIK